MEALFCLCTYGCMSHVTLYKDCLFTQAAAKIFENHDLKGQLSYLLYNKRNSAQCYVAAWMWKWSLGRMTGMGYGVAWCPLSLFTCTVTVTLLISQVKVLVASVMSDSLQPPNTK